MTRNHSDRLGHHRNRPGQRRDPARNGPGGSAGEDRRSLAATVAWMMATLVTGVALLLFGLARILLGAPATPSGRVNPLDVLPGVLLFTSIVAGSLALLLIPVVYRVRPVAPPLPVTVVSAGLAAGAWVVLLFTRVP